METSDDSDLYLAAPEEEGWKVRTTVIISIIVAPLINGGYDYFIAIAELTTDRQIRRELILDSYIFKVLPDILLLSIFLLVLFHILRRTDNRGLSLYLPIGLLLFILAICLSIIIGFRTSSVIPLGLRYIAPIMLFGIGQWYFTKYDSKTIGRLLLAVGGIGAVLGAIQTVLGAGVVYGSYSLYAFPSNFAAVLLITSTGAVTAQLSKRILISGSVLFIGVLITLGSGTAYVGLVFLIGLVVIYNLKYAWLGFPFTILLIAYTPEITGRPNIFQSIFGRVDKAVEFLTAASPIELLFGHGLGFGTNAHSLLVREEVISGPLIPASDSLFLALFIQFGIFGLASILLLILWLYAQAFKRLDTPHGRLIAYFIPVILVAGVTTDWLDLLPINWLFWLITGWFVGLIKTPRYKITIRGLSLDIPSRTSHD